MKTSFKSLILISALIATILISVIGVTSYTNNYEVFAAADDKYKALDTFSDTLSLIENSYVEKLDQKDIIYGAIKGMLQELDPHSTFYTPEKFKTFQIETKGSFGGLGITIGLKDNALTIIAPIEDTPAYKAGLKSGDIIIMINNEPTVNMSLEDAVSKMRGEPGTKVNITVARKDEIKPIEFKLERAIIKIQSVKWAQTDNIGYIRLTQFQESSSKEIITAMKKLDKSGVKGIILDLRNNGGGLLSEAINVSSIFLPANKSVVYTKDRSNKDNHYNTKKVTYRDNNRPLIVIVNEGSASASEILAGALQDYKRALVIGKTTFGKASVQSIIEMKDGSAVKLTTARYYTPLGRSIQGVGIVPDVEVASGKINYDDNSFIIKEKDLSKHLLGENESNIGKSNLIVEKSNSTVLPPSDDLQYNSALQILKGMMKYEKTNK